MSRRAKLIFSALFLVLLGASLAGVILTWRPKNPLRFTIIAPAPEDALVIPGSDSINDRAFYVTVENISGREIIFYSGSVMSRLSPHPPATGPSDPHGWINPFEVPGEGKSGGELIIPPHGTVRIAMVLLPARRKEILRDVGGEVTYNWTTEKRIRWREANLWLMDRVPESTWDYVYVTHELSDTTPLELPAR